VSGSLTSLEETYCSSYKINQKENKKMSISKYIEKSKYLDERLNIITKRVESQTILRIANYRNSDFVELMREREKLIELSDRLLEIVEKEYGRYWAE
jgi:hypothetical protein